MKKTIRWLALLAVVLAALAALTVACSPAATPTPTPKATNTPTPTAAATATAAPTATPTTAAVKQTAKITYAVALVNPIVGMPWGAPYNDWENAHTYGITESLFVYKDGSPFSPFLASSWKMSDDGKKATMVIRPGIKFNAPVGTNKDFGELTADDVVFYMNSSNSSVNPKSTHGDAGDFAASFGEAKAIDKYTVEVPLVTPFYFTTPMSEFGGMTVGPGILSKKVYDTMGPEWMADHAVGTGPFIQKEWKAQDTGTVVAVPNHWNDTAKIAEFKLVQVPELSSRVAMIKTGAADAGVFDFKVVDDLIKSGLKFDSGPSGAAYTAKGVVTESASLLMTGNLWEETHARTGEPLNPWTSPAYAKDYPWIGNPWGDKVPYKDTDNPPGMDDMQQAKLVRQAMALAIDRQGIVHNILHDMAWAIPTEYSSPNRPEIWKATDAIPYDPVKAGQLLDQAGYPKKADGSRFDLTIWNYPTAEIGEVVLEIGDAIASTYNQLGIRTTLDRSNYATVISPAMRKREAFWPVIKNGDVPTNVYPADWNLPPADTSISRPGWGCGFENKFEADIYYKALVEPDRAKRVAMQREVVDYMLDQNLMIGVIELPRGVVYDPRKIKSWNSRLSMFVVNWGPQFIVPTE